MFFAESARIWQSQWLDMAKTTGLPGNVFQSHRKVVDSLAARIYTVSTINHSAVEVRSQFSHLMELSRNIGQDMTRAVQAFKTTNLAINSSVKIIAETNDFFASERGVRAIVPTAPIFKTAKNLERAEKLEQTEAHLSIAATESEENLHINGAELIFLANTIVTNLKEELVGVIDEKFSHYKHVLNRMEILANPANFLTLLQQFAAGVTKNYTKEFWQKPGEKFVTNPEALAKSYLGIFLSGAFGDIAFIGPEIASGDGYVDILVNFLGSDYVVELKIVGAGWSIGWAESGLDQLNRYMKTYGCDESYLVVFDGRKTTRGRQLNAFYEMPNGRVNVVTIRIYN